MATKHPAYEKFDLEIRGGQEMEEAKKAAGVASYRGAARERTDDLAKTDRDLKKAIKDREARERKENEEKAARGEPIYIELKMNVPLPKSWEKEGSYNNKPATKTTVAQEKVVHPAYEGEDLEIETGTELREAKEAAGVSTPEEARKRQADLAELDPKLKEELEKREKREKEEGEK